MPRASLLVTSSAVLFGVTAACGARTGLPTGVDTCTGVPVGQIRQVPNIYFVIDRSFSMNDGMPRSKWEIVRSDVSDLIVTLGKEANFGATLFPLTGVVDACASGQEVMSLRPGDGLPASDPGSTAHAFLDATRASPLGGTPTAETFITLTSKLPDVPGHTFAILATDGGPNCNLGLSCGEDQCTLNIDSRGDCRPQGPKNCCDPAVNGAMAARNCLDGDRTVEAIAALAAKGVPTFVIGVPGSEAYASILDEAAKAGRTPRATSPYYYPVNTASSSSLVDALANIAARIAASCELELKHAPAADQTNLVVDGHIVPQAGGNGWTVKGDFVTLLGATCDRVRTLGQNVVVTEGCPTRLK